ncbi:hypothetical protein I6E23_05950 [Prevotella brevis]|nr:hypothetical protein [Xylanibacter brevis]
MKSIKEKAEEYGYTNWQSDEYHDGASEGLEFDPIGHTQKTFEAGANYVLEEIENVIKSDRILGHPFPSLEMRYNQIISLIEQLKK